MPKKISNEVLQKAQELRTQGKPYEEISKALQVSVSWCKHNLSSALAQKKYLEKSLKLSEVQQILRLESSVNIS